MLGPPTLQNKLYDWSVELARRISDNLIAAANAFDARVKELYKLHQLSVDNWLIENFRSPLLLDTKLHDKTLFKKFRLRPSEQLAHLTAHFESVDF